MCLCVYVVFEFLYGIRGKFTHELIFNYDLGVKYEFMWNSSLYMVSETHEWTQIIFFMWYQMAVAAKKIYIS